MPAPNKIIARVGDFRISAFYLGDIANSAKSGVVCKKCAPSKTRLVFVGEVVLPSKKGDHHFVCYECKTCSRQWCVSAYADVLDVEGKDGPTN